MELEQSPLHSRDRCLAGTAIESQQIFHVDTESCSDKEW